MVCFFIILFLFESSYIHSTSYIDGERVKKSTLTLIEVFAGKLFIGNFFLSLLRRTSRIRTYKIYILRISVSNVFYH